MNTTPSLAKAECRVMMTAKARTQLAREVALGKGQSPHWVAVYTKRVLCEHMRIDTRPNGYGIYECPDCGQAI